MTSEKTKDSIRIAEELAKEICTDETSSSLLVDKWKETSSDLYEELRKQENLPLEISFHDSINVKDALHEINKRITRPSRIFNIRTIGIAASFLLIIGASSLWLWNGEQEKAMKEWTSSIPGASKPSIIAQDNQSVELDDNHLMVRGNQLFGSKLDGKKNVILELKPDNQFNRLSVPAGGEYQLTLEDGTVVQVNAASDLLFPTHFKKDIRQVHLNGEAHFKVKTNTTSPFYVYIGALNVQVTGTTFNIKAYQKEESINIALIEGSVNVREGQKLLATLAPGQMLTYQKSTHTYQVCEAALSVITSWTNGQFIFYDETIDNIMRDLSRWYGVDIRVSDDIKNLRYSGMLSREQPLLEMLNALSFTNELDFKIHKNKKIDAVEKKDQQ